MKKLFGQYLVEQKIITEDILLKALVEQVKRIPSVCEMVYELKLLNEKQILDVLAAQSQSMNGFIETSKTLGLWSEAIDAGIKKHLNAVRVPLGHLLVEMKAASFDDMTHALDEFLGEIEDTPASTPTPTPAPQKEAPLSTEPPQDETPKIDHQLLSDYQEIVNDTKRDEILNLLEAFSLWSADQIKSEEACKITLTKLADDFHSFSGVASFIRASYSEKVFKFCEELIRALPNLKDENQLKEVQSSLISATQMAWSIRDTMLSEQSESAYFNQAEQKTNYENLTQQLETITGSLSNG